MAMLHNVLSLTVLEDDGVSDGINHLIASNKQLYKGTAIADLQDGRVCDVCPLLAGDQQIITLLLLQQQDKQSTAVSGEMVGGQKKGQVLCGIPLIEAPPEKRKKRQIQNDWLRG